ncbi:hypothetical protein EVAR_84126_1 [Eumeta japonica]|uniref:Uncharacterized protein n=1 Tax=Eumeta variegata TaxID=151549 RepID=A0A4C1UZK5_EUMVA|nr:hypothetical protein EVAR_84126_1 [Eumeta japonica]
MSIPLTLSISPTIHPISSPVSFLVSVLAPALSRAPRPTFDSDTTQGTSMNFVGSKWEGAPTPALIGWSEIVFQRPQTLKALDTKLFALAQCGLRAANPRRHQYGNA